MADEQLRMRASVDYDGRGLRNLKNDMREVSNLPGAKQLAKDWKGVRDEIDKATGGIRSSFLPALNGVGLSSLGVVGGLTAIATAVRGFSRETQTLSMFSKEVGISTDRIRAFSELGERFGTNADTMKSAMQALASNMHDLRRRWGTAYGELRAMNLGDLADELAKSANNQEAMTKAFDRLGKISDPEARRRVSTLLFGTADLGAVAAAVGGDLQKILDEIEKRQGSIDDRMEKASRKFEENMSRMRQNLDQLRVNSLGPTLEVANKLVETFQKRIEFGADNTPQSKIVERQDQVRRQLDVLEGMGNQGPGGTPRSPETQRKIDKLNEELRDLTEQLKKLNEGATVQKQSFGGGGFGGGGMGGLIQNASFGGGGIVGPGFYGASRGAAVMPGGGGGVSLPAPGTTGESAKTGDNTLDAIIAAEGTGKGGRNPFDTVLGYGKYGLPPKPISQMTLDEAYAFGRQVRARHGSSSALGAFQIVGSTMRAAQRGLGLSGDTVFGRETQIAMANWIRQKQGLGAWEGLKVNPSMMAKAVRGGTYDVGGNFPAVRSRSDLAAASGSADVPYPLGWGPKPTGGAPSGAGTYGNIDLLGRAIGSGAMGGGAAPQKVEGSASLDITINGVGSQYKARTSMDGMFKDVRLNRGKAMGMAEDYA